MATHLIFPQFMNDRNETDRKKVMDMCLEILSRCDELWCFGEKLSEGVVQEMDFAKKYKIKIRRFTNLCDPLPKRRHSMDTKAFLITIYRDCPEGYITLTLLPERKTLWFKVNEIEKVLASVKKHGAKTNTFFGVCETSQKCASKQPARQ